MKNFIILFILSLVFVGCKVPQKKQLNKESGSLVKPRSKDSRPVISSINGKYIFKDSTTIQVFMMVEVGNITEQTTFKDLDNIFKIQWSIQTEYGTKEKLKSGRLEFSDQNFSRKGNVFYLSFEVPNQKTEESGVLILDFIDQSLAMKFTNDLPIDFRAKKVDTRFNLYSMDNPSMPSFQSYVSLGKEFMVKSILPSNEKLFLKRYKNEVSPALSPMSSSKRDALDGLEPVEIKQIKSGQILKLDLPGIYVLTQEPDFHEDGYGFLVVDDRFPKLTYPDELRKALVYMSTPKEIDALMSTENPKEALDLYFLNVSKGNQTVAKQIIKSYYKKVGEANKLFSTYKEGWKSDKGMVYIIMGPPSRVQRNRQREVWLYTQNQNNSEIIFTFYRKSNVFSDQNYELVRYPEYSTFWYPYVEAWRTGNAVE